MYGILIIIFLQTSSRFPAHLVFSSLAPPPQTPFSFPLFSSSHAAFLVGFYNHQNRQVSTPSSQAAPNAAITAAPQKRVAPPEVSTANKKPKPNAPPIPTTKAPAVRQVPNPTPSLPSTSLPLQRSSPAIPTPPPSAPNEHLQKYIAEMHAAASRKGAPPPTLVDIQNALAAYTVPLQQNQPPAAFLTQQQQAKKSTSINNVQQTQQQIQQQQIMQQQQHLRNGQSSPAPGGPRQLTPGGIVAHGLTAAQIENLPQLDEEMRRKIENHVAGIRNQAAQGKITQEQVSNQMRKLQEVATR